MLGHRTLNAQDYLAILKRRWWVICIPALVLPVVAVVSTYFITPKYDSTSLILIDQQKVSSEVVKPLDLGDLQGRLGLITAQIESRTSMEPIVAKYNLYANQHLPMEARVDLVRKNLSIAPIQSQIDRANGLPGFKVVFTADDPRTAQQVCADVTGLYTQNDLLNKQSMTKGTNDFLASQLAEEKRKLGDIEQRKAEFESKYMGSLPGDAGSTTSVLSSLSTRLDADNQRITADNQSKQLMEVALNQALAAGTSAGTVVKTQQADETELIKAQSDLAAMEAQYTDAYPPLQAAKRRVADLQAQIAKAAAAPAPLSAPAPRVESNDVAQLRTRIRLLDEEIAAKTKDQADLQAQMRSYEGRLHSSPIVEQQYTEITRDYTTENATYQKLLQQMDQSGMATEMQNQQKGETFTVLDAASLPIDPTFPKQSVFAFGGLGGGIALGLLIVAFLEYRDTALRTERDVWAFTQLPTLAIIAYSTNVSEGRVTQPGLLKRIFQRKSSKELLAG